MLLVIELLIVLTLLIEGLFILMTIVQPTVNCFTDPSHWQLTWLDRSHWSKCFKWSDLLIK